MNAKYLALPFALGVCLSFDVAQAQTQTALPSARCTAAEYVDGGDDTVIQTSGFSYTPKCLHIRVGSSVTIQASSHHPLSAMPDIDDAANPFAQATPFVAPTTQVFNQPGLYGYFCENHGDATGAGMAGLILVD